MDNIHPIFDRIVDRQAREAFLKQQSKVLWMTGLSGSGKSTIAIQLEKLLFSKGHFCQILDGDNIRSGLNSNLGFSLADRKENIRRIAEVAKLYCSSGVVCICSFVSPTIEIRNFARDVIGENDFIEIFINTPLDVCEQRDVKGLYKKARAGKISNFTGIDSPFEVPQSPTIEVKTVQQTVEESARQIYNYIKTIIKH